MEGFRVSSRRSLLVDAGKLAVVSAFGRWAQAASGADASAQVIDVHHHYLPPFYIEKIKPWLDWTHSSALDTVMHWTTQKDTAALDRAGIQTALLSISSPGFDSPGYDFGTETEVALLARRCNEFAADLKKNSKGRYLFLTALPMPNLDASLKEIAYGYDVLGATGVGLMTNYRGLYLGDKRFAPLFDELNRRGALVFVHPTDAPCCRDLIPDVPAPNTEFLIDTGRTITSLLWAGTLSRCPRIRFIFPHGGGILPTIHSRITAGMERVHPELKSRVPGGAANELTKLYVDMASIANNPAFSAMEAWAKPSHILFGSDYPWLMPEPAVTALASLVPDAEKLAMIYRGNAMTLLGR